MKLGYFTPRFAQKAVASLAAVAAVSACLSQPARAEELIYSLIAPNHPLNQPVFGVWAENVATATEGRVTVRFDTAETGPGPVRTFAVDDPQLRPADD